MSFPRYVAVGGGATATHYAFLLFAVESRWLAPPTAAAAGALIGALIAYLGNHRYTFASARAHRTAAPRFFLIAAFGALLNGAIVWLGCTRLGWHYLLAQLPATALVLLLTYLLNRRWTFA